MLKTAGLLGYACDFCRRRKLKCLKEVPNCDKCLRYQQKCIYSPQNRKVTLTKSVFYQLQNRISVLEKVLEELVPDQDQLAKLINNASNSLDTGNSQVESQSETPNVTEIKEEEYLLDELGDIDEMVLIETDNDNITTDQKLSDSMSALAIESKSLRMPIYYGLASSSGLIRYLQKVDKNTKRNLIENYKPTVDLVDYKLNLELIKHEFGELFLDNINFHAVIFDSYFSTFHVAYPLLHKDLFFRDYDNLSSKNPMQKKCLTILIYTVLAFGAYIKYGDESVVDLLYYKRVREILKLIDIMEYNSFYLLEALTILANYCQKRNKPNTGWNYHGVCFRMAVSFGLHREVNVSNEELTEKDILALERRRRIFWGLYVLDVGHALTLGRPAVAPSLSCVNLKFPSVDFDHTGTKRETGPNYIEGFVLEMKLLKISTRIQELMCDMHKGFIQRITELKELNQEIENFAKDTPSYFKEESTIDIPIWLQFRRVKLIWRYKNVQISMFRNCIWQLNNYTINGKKFAREIKLITECLNICINASCDTIESVRRYLDSRELNNFSAWYGIYFIFHAVLLLILITYNLRDQFPQDKMLSIEHNINLSKEMLLKLRKFNRLSPNLIELIDILSKGVKEGESPNYSVNSEDLFNELFTQNMDEFKTDFDKSLNDAVLDLSPIGAMDWLEKWYD